MTPLRGFPREVILVVSERDGMVFETRSVGYVWLNPMHPFTIQRERQIAVENGGTYLTACSTSNWRVHTLFAALGEPYYEK